MYEKRLSLCNTLLVVILGFAARYGEAFEQVKARTSTIPFAAIIDGRQQAPEGWIKEFVRCVYLGHCGTRRNSSGVSASVIVALG